MASNPPRARRPPRLCALLPIETQARPFPPEIGGAFVLLLFTAYAWWKERSLWYYNAQARFEGTNEVSWRDDFGNKADADSQL